VRQILGAVGQFSRESGHWPMLVVSMKATDAQIFHDGDTGNHAGDDLSMWAPAM
jgi:hypothetical protein